MSVIVDAFMDGTVSDALLVPVSVNYERLVDGNFVHEQLGQKKKPESFRSASKAIWKVSIILSCKLYIFLNLLLNSIIGIEFTVRFNAY